MPLTITEATVTDSDAYIVTTAMPIELQPCASAPLALEFAPPEEGPSIATLSMAHDGSDGASDLELNGTEAYPWVEWREMIRAWD